MKKDKKTRPKPDFKPIQKTKEEKPKLEDEEFSDEIDRALLKFYKEN